jgi:hypothetical protein
MAMGMVWGRRLNTNNLERLVNDALATLDEFGEPGADAGEVIDGPLADPAARLDFANRGLRRTAIRLAAQSPFYADQPLGDPGDPQARPGRSPGRLPLR